MRPKTFTPTRIFALVTFALLIFVVGVAVAAAQGNDQSEESGVQAESTSVQDRVKELPNRRTATSNTFLLDNGSLETQLFEVPVNYKDEDGDWEPIDEGLHEAPSGAISNGDNSFDLRLPADLNEAPIKVSLADAWISEKPVGIEVGGSDLQGDSAATYAADGNSATFEFNGLPDGLKETIFLADASAPTAYHFELDASAGLEPTLEEDGSIVFRGAAGEAIAEMPAPIMSDSSGQVAPAGAVRYELSAIENGTWSLYVQTDPGWLRAEGRSWPVAIDPTLKLDQGTLDCVITNDGTNTSYCSPLQSYRNVKANYQSNGTDLFARTLLRFNLSSIPATASITAATVGLYASSEAKNVSRVDLYDVSRSWDSNVTWTKYQSAPPNSGLWTNPGGDYGKYLPQPTSITTAQRGSGPGPWEFFSTDLTYLVNRWQDGTVPNNGLLLKLAEETPRVCCLERRVQWQGSTEANKPYLSVQFIEAAGADKKVTSPTDGTKTAKRFLLSAAWEQSGVEGITFQYKGEKGWVNIPQGQVLDSKTDQSVTWPLTVAKLDRTSRPLYWDASALTGTNPTAKVQIRAVFTDIGGISTYSKPVAAEVDKNAGGPKDAVTGVGPGSVDLLTGSFTISRTDLSIPGIGSAMEFSRSFSSREAGVEATGVLGPGWKPSFPVEQAGGSAWTKVKLEELTENFEGESETFKWAAVSHAEGGEIDFEEANNQFVTPPEVSGFSLYRLSSTEIALTDPEGNRTTFSNEGSGNEYLPKSIAQTGGATNTTKFLWEFVNGKRRLKRLAAPSHKERNCTTESWSTDGCRLLEFSYQSATTWGAPESAGARLAKITYNSAGSGEPVQEVAKFEYNSSGRLIGVWDPRISPALKEIYAYNSDGQISTLTPPGQEPWTMQYGQIAGDTSKGRLVSVKRATLVETNPTAQTTIAYGVPLTTGAGGPYAMNVEGVAAWGQSDVPTDATAIFSPDEVPASPPSSWTRATVYYMDAEGQLSNVATPSGAGTSAPSITTTETDQFGNVTRELSAQNRLRALAQGSGSAARSRELDSQFRYSPDGTELQEEEGPMHQVRLPETGTLTQARSYRAVEYDYQFKYLNGTETPSPGETKPHLPTSETSGALLATQEVVDKRTTKYIYNWKLRKPTEVISNPETSDENKSVTLFDPDSGLPTEIRQPKEAATGGGAGTTKIVYYRPTGPGNGGPNIPACESNAYAGLPCKTEPAAQPGTAGQPNLPVRQILSYNSLGEALKVTETSGASTRETEFTYDPAGRQTYKQIVGGGLTIPKVLTEYGQGSGLPTAERFVCPASEPECDRQSVFTTYDKLGRVTTYKDADNNEAKTTYDYLGRAITLNDGKGTQTLRYDSVTGLHVELEDSAAGLFTASYDADGQMIEQGLPNGLTRKTSFDEVGQPVSLTYTKSSSCGVSCTWLNFAVERSINGQILLENGSVGKDEYAYDKLGRLITARQTPAGGSCTTRNYKFDADSNRQELTTIAGVGSTCASSGGTSKKYTYDSADRLLGGGITYDNFGRITSLPGEFAGGKAITTEFFANDMVATQTQNGVTNTFQLDAMLRQRQRLQAGGLEGTEIFHYAGQTDSPAWTQRGSNWTRSISGMGGELAAIQESGKEVELQLTNIHGDVSATAALSPTATALKLTASYDEFGNQTAGTLGRRYGWLGGKHRRTEFASGVVQMGKRSYVPTLGRFLSPDPVFGGSANPYDYANQDPVNNLDLTGEKCYGTKSQVKSCKAWKIKYHATHRTKAAFVQFKSKSGAERFLDYLKGANNTLEKWQAKVGRWKEEEYREMVKRARERAGPLPAATPITCKDISHGLTYAGAPGIALSFVPGAGWGVAIFGTGVSVTGLAVQLADDVGLC